MLWVNACTFEVNEARHGSSPMLPRSCCAQDLSSISLRQQFQGVRSFGAGSPLEQASATYLKPQRRHGQAPSRSPRAACVCVLKLWVDHSSCAESALPYGRRPDQRSSSCLARGSSSTAAYPDVSSPILWKAVWSLRATQGALEFLGREKLCGTSL